MKYVYLYKITLKKKRKKPLYYFGIRSCECLPEDDPYMGSPKTYADLWKDESYVKTKEILKFGEYDTWFEKFRDEEVKLIKEGWNQFGVYGKDEKGSCLNVCVKRSVIFTPDVRARHKEAIKEAMKRPEVKARVKEARNRPEVKAKISGDNSPMNRPEVKARHKEAIKEAMNRPEVKARHKEAVNRPENIKKMLESRKRNKLLCKLQNAAGSLEPFFT